MAETAPREGVAEVVCPHCRKQFKGDVLAASSARHAGFKCPHCKLFVTYDRTEER